MRKMIILAMGLLCGASMSIYAEDLTVENLHAEQTSAGTLSCNSFVARIGYTYPTVWNASITNLKDTTLFKCYKTAMGKDAGMSPLVIDAASVTMTNKLSVNGTIECKDNLIVAEIDTKTLRANDVKVDLNNAADYVFEENYDLKSLNEVEAYVKANKHLPGVPSASELKDEGMSVSEMSNLLLEKVEELTLHMIELKKENQALKAEIEALKK